jgi:hypothetical protein
MFIARTGQFSLWIVSRELHAPLPAPLIREALRRRARLLPFARVNGIRLRGLGKLAEAACTLSAGQEKREAKRPPVSCTVSMYHPEGAVNGISGRSPWRSGRPQRPS